MLLLLLLAASPVDAAKAHLQKGQLDEVLFDLEGKKLTATEQPEAVKVLSAASRAALDAKDAVMAQHLAAMALKLDAKSTPALEAASRAALAQQEFTAAERHADAWIAADPSSPDARLLRAELAAEAGEWDRVLEQLAAAKLDTPAARTLRTRAQNEKSQRESAMSELRGLTKAMEAAAKKPLPPGPPVPAVRPAPTGDVVLYGTSWCGYCKKAREWLTRKGVSFVDRDIEQDEDARAELARKAQAAGVQPRGVPVIDVRGKLILGFDPREIERAL